MWSQAHKACDLGLHILIMSLLRDDRQCGLICRQTDSLGSDQSDRQCSLVKYPCRSSEERFDYYCGLLDKR